MPEIVNASHKGVHAPSSFLLVGGAGAGKTTQIWSLPKPCLVIFFDPYGSAALRGYDIDCIEFVSSETSFHLMSEKKHKTGRGAPPAAYLDFLSWANAAVESGLFDKYCSVVIDSLTAMESAITEAIMHDAGRMDNAPSTDDMVMIRRNLYSGIRSCAVQKKIFMATAHLAEKTNRAGEVLCYSIDLIGKNRRLLPTLFSEIIYCDYRVGKGVSRTEGAKYVGLTKPDGIIDTARVSRHDLPLEIDLTIRDWNKPDDYGLGKLLKESGEWPKTK